ncbi:hypothetical protein Q8F55_001619 [Vanrija albida]|uniref:Major facilitator superfamily (MFS) profile domain-containing protein n=1 Tax=Vanrija albida TaxID=181172 RepID=A0ABR3QGK5_9TREE
MATNLNSGSTTPPADDEKRSMTQQDVLEVVNNPAAPIQYTKWQKFVSAVWDPDYYLKSEAERRLLIDQTNLSNAYSGLKEDLNIHANEYTRMLTIYNAVYCVLQVPSNMIVMKVRPSWWLAGCELGWTIFTFAQAAAQTVPQMYVFRFLVAFFEAAFQPVSYFLLGSWYTKKELGKRMAIWFSAAPLGNAFSGYMQAAIYKGLNGSHGVAGWRWLYVVCGGMTLPAVVCVFFLVPDFPNTTKSWYITEEEKEMAKRRCANNGTEDVHNVVSWSAFVDMAKGWRFWLIPFMYIFYGFCVQAYQYFGIFLKAAGFSVEMRNILPSSSWIASVPFQMFIGYISDKTGSRFEVIMSVLSLQMIPAVILAIWPKSTDLKISAFFMNVIFFTTSIIYTWISEICHANAQERGVVLGLTNTAFFAVNAWLPNVVFLQTDAPSFRKGFPTLLACLVSCMILVCAVRVLYARQEKKRSQEEGHGDGDVEQPGVDAKH